jgi:chemotaxis protein MotB
MSESNQPFTDLVTKKKARADSSGIGWVAAVLMAVVAATFYVFWHSSQSLREREVAGLKSRLDEAATNLSNALAQIQTNQDEIAQLKFKIADLENEKAATVQKASGLENEMRQQLESKDVTIATLQGKLTVSILDRVMFDSGEAVLKPGGAAVMQKIAALLAAHPAIKVHVIGHTDNVPIRIGAQSRFASNWELSAARALAAVHYLTEQGGVDPRRVGAVGYGEYRPIADNATAEGRARNRRIAITILPDELAGADTAPTAKPAASTNAPPLSAVSP